MKYFALICYATISCLPAIVPGKGLVKFVTSNFDATTVTIPRTNRPETGSISFQTAFLRSSGAEQSIPSTKSAFLRSVQPEQGIPSTKLSGPGGPDLEPIDQPVIPFRLSRKQIDLDEPIEQPVKPSRKHLAIAPTE